MTRRRAPRCARCNKPFRKGESVWVEQFTTWHGVDAEGRYGIAPWAQIMQHSRCWERSHEAEGTVAVWRRVVQAKQEKAS